MFENNDARSKRTKRSKVLLPVAVIVTVIIPLVMFGTVLYLSQFHLDLSQDYRSIKGHENIVFMDYGNKQCFHLCAWEHDKKTGSRYHVEKETFGDNYQEQ